MKITLLVLVFICCAPSLLDAKDPISALEAIRKYGNKEPVGNRGEMSDKEIEMEISNLIQDKPNQGHPARTLEILELIRNKAERNPSLVSPLRALWKFYHAHTLRSKNPEYWMDVRSLDSAQFICNEVKFLIVTAGGNVDDIEPVSERNTFDLKELWGTLKSSKDAVPVKTLEKGEFQSAASKLSVIVVRCTFGSGSDDEIIQLQYIHQIIKVLGDVGARAAQMPIEKDDPIVHALDVALAKTLPLIDDNWVQKPTGNKGPNQGDPSAEQTAQWRKNSLEGSQQASMRKIRDQILINVSNWISQKKEDAAFKQEMLNRFGKNDDIRKSIEERVNTSD